MDLNFLEKLLILGVLFVGVTIGTSYIVGNYVSIKKEANYIASVNLNDFSSSTTIGA